MAVGQLGMFLLHDRSSPTPASRPGGKGRRARGDRRRQHPHLSHALGRRPGGRSVLGRRAGAQHTLTLFCLGIVVVMAYALSTDLLRAKQLVIELSESGAGGGAGGRGGEPRHLHPRHRARRDRGQRQVARAVRLRARRTAEPGARCCSRSTSTIARGIRREHGLAMRADRGRVPRRVHASPLPDGRMRWIAAIGRVEFDVSAAGRCAAAAPASTSPRASWPSRRCCACARTSPTSAGSR